MKNIILTWVQDFLNEQVSLKVSDLAYQHGQSIFANGQCIVLAESEKKFEFEVDEKQGVFLVTIETADGIKPNCSCKSQAICRHQFAALFQIEELLKNIEILPKHGIKYSRQGMIRRVIEERKSRALMANYTIEFAENVFGEHKLTNERGKIYKLTFRDFRRRQGYCTCPDYRTNKLGTCKHLIFAFENLQNLQFEIPEHLPDYPFIEIYLNPYRNYKISWYYPEKPQGKTAELIYRYFGNKNYLDDDEILNFLGFVERAENFRQILIRPEVLKKMGEKFEEAAIQRLMQNKTTDYSELKVKLLPFQVLGAEFAAFRTGAVIADEIGLGKTIQAIAAAETKIKTFGFTKILVICPDWSRQHWQHEILRVCGKSPIILDGSLLPEMSNQNTHYSIADYETVIGNLEAVRHLNPDFLIIDEAQRIKDYESPIAAAIKSIPRKHVLVLTSNLFENQLIELYSIILLVDPALLAPLWEFSYQHFYFDENEKNKITGQYDQDKLWKKLEKIIIRREKHEVIKQLPSVGYIENPVRMHPSQARLHLKYAGEAVMLLKKNMITAFDRQRFLMLLKMMRQVSNSTFLIDTGVNHSSKLTELRHILLEKLNLRAGNRKIVIYTEWDIMNRIISQMLHTNQINFLEITSETDPADYDDVITKFIDDHDCNLIIASTSVYHPLLSSKIDTVINFDVPVSKSLQNSRIGDIATLSENDGRLTIINLISKDSIEQLITQEDGFEHLFIPKSDFNDDDIQDIGFAETDRVRLLKSLESLINNLNSGINETKIRKKPDLSQMSINFSEEADEHEFLAESTETAVAGTVQKPHRKKEIQKSDLKPDEQKFIELMEEGAGFFGSLFRASTGITLSANDYMINYDKGNRELLLKIIIPKKNE